MTPDELREKVARAIYAAAGFEKEFCAFDETSSEYREKTARIADAAIAVVLEEAARVADKMAFNQAIGIASENGEEQRWFEHGKYVADQTAAAIRAMKKD